MDGFACVVSVMVRFSDCDPLGHVNNAVFFTYLEEARFGWFRAVFGENGFKEHPIILGEITCRFRSVAVPGENLSVGIRVERIGNASFEHRYRIESTGPVTAASEASPVPRRSGRLVAEARSTGVGYDYARNASRALGEAFRAGIEKFQGPLPA